MNTKTSPQDTGKSIGYSWIKKNMLDLEFLTTEDKLLFKRTERDINNGTYIFVKEKSPNSVK